MISGSGGAADVVGVASVPVGHGDRGAAYVLGEVCSNFVYLPETFALSCGAAGVRTY